MSRIAIPSRQRQQGRTIVELMIAVTIGLVILLALGIVYVSTTSTSRQSDNVTRMSEDAAIAMNIIGTNIRMAGYSPIRRIVLPGTGAKFGDKRRLVTDRNLNGAGITGCDKGFSNVATAFGSFSKTVGCNPLATSQPAGLAVRMEGDTWNTVPITDPGTGVTDPSDCLANRITSAMQTNSDIDANVKYRSIDSRYFAKQSTNGTPELYCAGRGNNFNPDPLLQYVENIQFLYAIASDGIRRENTYYDNADRVHAQVGGGGGGTTTFDDRWNRVVAVKVCLVIRSRERDQAGGGNYIDCAGNSVASTDGFLRRSFTSVYSLRNRSDFQTP